MQPDEIRSFFPTAVSASTRQHHLRHNDNVRHDAPGILGLGDFAVREGPRSKQNHMVPGERNVRRIGVLDKIHRNGIGAAADRVGAEPDL